MCALFLKEKGAERHGRLYQLSERASTPYCRGIAARWTPRWNIIA